jgi:transposase
MGKYSAELFVGMDVSDKSVEIYILPKDAEEGKSLKVKNDQRSLTAFAESFVRPSSVKLALETGTHSSWQAELFRGKGIETVVANARDLRMIWASDKKDDREDAKKLARLLRADPKLLHGVEVKAKGRRDALAVVKARDCLSRCRTKLINTVRGLLKSEGVDSSEIKAAGFGSKASALIPAELKAALDPLVAQISNLDFELKSYDKQLARMMKEFDGCTEVSQIKGVGPVTSIAFVLTVGEADRFQNGERLASYVGLTPKRDQSGETDKQCHISKTGSKLLRRNLVQAAHYIMGPFGDKDCDLRKFGERIAARGGKNAKKRAVVAVARKLVVLMLKLWKSRGKYEPQYSKRKERPRKDKAA